MSKFSEASASQSSSHKSASHSLGASHGKRTKSQCSGRETSHGPRQSQRLFRRLPSLTVSVTIMLPRKLRKLGSVTHAGAQVTSVEKSRQRTKAVFCSSDSPRLLVVHSRQVFRKPFWSQFPRLLWAYRFIISVRRYNCNLRHIYRKPQTIRKVHKRCKIAQKCS